MNQKLEEMLIAYSKEKENAQVSLILEQLHESSLYVPIRLDREGKSYLKLSRLKEGQETVIAACTRVPQRFAAAWDKSFRLLPFLQIVSMASQKAEVAAVAVIFPGGTFTIRRPMMDQILRVAGHRSMKAKAEEQRRKRQEQMQSPQNFDREKWEESCGYLVRHRFDPLRERRCFELGYLPWKLMTGGAAFIKRLEEEKAAYVDGLFEECYSLPREYPYLEEEFSVVSLRVGPHREAIRIDFPERDLTTGCLTSAFVIWDEEEARGYYFGLRLGDELEASLIEVEENLAQKELGKAPEEGLELQTILRYNTVAFTKEEF